MEWNLALYDKKHDFVAEYGKGLLEFVPKNSGQVILDLGCDVELAFLPFSWMICVIKL